MKTHCDKHGQQGWAREVFGGCRRVYKDSQRRILPRLTISRISNSSIQSLLTARAGSFPQEYMRANSSPVMLRHHRVCCIEPRGTATFKHASSSPMSRRHSIAAAFVMCARGVSAVLGVAASMIPFSPIEVQHGSSSLCELHTILCKEAGQ